MEEKIEKVKPKKEVSAVRIDGTTQKLLSSIINKINKKDFGRKVKASQLLHFALTKISEQDIKQMQETTLSNTDRIELRRREHVKKFGHISKDDFLGFLLTQESRTSEAKETN